MAWGRKVLKFTTEIIERANKLFWRETIDK